VRAVQLRGDEAEDRRKMLEAAQGSIDCVLDLLPPAANQAWVRAAIMTLRPNGHAVLMGGVGAQAGNTLGLSYSWPFAELWLLESGRDWLKHDRC
jgi:alcohol dehydrogenase